MILVDTCIWAEHLGRPDQRLIDLVQTDDICAHPHVIGELALGNLRQFDVVIRFLKSLRQVNTARDDEVLTMVRDHKLSGSGIGYSDAHLIASLLITPDTLLWTRDKRLYAVAQRFGLTIKP